MMLLVVIGIILVILVVWMIGAYNGFVSSKNKIEEAFSTMDVYMKKRWDLIPNLVNTVKGYAEHEKETLSKVTEMRSKSYESMTLNEKVEADRGLGSALGRLIATAESYPELKANENFVNLQNQLNQIENDIANSRKYYNGCVRQMNTKVESFPSNIIAGMFHFEKYQMFEVEDAGERKNVKVEF